MTNLSHRWWEYLPGNFRANKVIRRDLNRIALLDKEIADTIRHNTAIIHETRTAIEKRIAVEFTDEEIRAAKIKAGNGEFCSCGRRVTTRSRHCLNCGKELFPF